MSSWEKMRDRPIEARPTTHLARQTEQKARSRTRKLRRMNRRIEFEGNQLIHREKLAKMRKKGRLYMDHGQVKVLVKGGVVR